MKISPAVRHLGTGEPMNTRLYADRRMRSIAPRGAEKKEGEIERKRRYARMVSEDGRMRQSSEHCQEGEEDNTRELGLSKRRKEKHYEDWPHMAKGGGR